MSQEQQSTIHRGEILFGVLLSILLVGTLIRSLSTYPTADPLKKESVNTEKGAISTQSPTVVQPLQCTIVESGASVSAYLEEKRAFAISLQKGVKTITLLKEDGCLYSWSNQNTKGVRLCGVGQFLPLIRSMLLDTKDSRISSGLSSLIPTQAASIIPKGLAGLPYVCKSSAILPIPTIPKGTQFD